MELAGAEGADTTSLYMLVDDKAAVIGKSPSLPIPLARQMYMGKFIAVT